MTEQEDTRTDAILAAKVRELRNVLLGRDAGVPLDVAALQIAKIEYPQIHVQPFLDLLDSYANEFAERLRPGAGGLRFVDELNDYLFSELGFEGDAVDYYNPANSCLNEVLAKRSGLPITLSIVYMEIARRLGRRVVGVGLPGHFIVRYLEPDFDIYIDPFNKGRLLSERECFELAESATNAEVARNPDLLQPVSNRHIAVRILNNLRGSYFRRENPRKAIEVLDLLIEAFPDSASEHQQRAWCLLSCGRNSEARDAFERYLRLVPSAPDRSQVEAQIRRIDLQDRRQ